ncbi:hypothetical protein [Altererythrobacter epoxidivorans]|uniref:hypothetical protein n=1 Tax=Altererythrobacter epoxidivorans TaxID=361183 RepID=UPI000AD5208A|nr:hypothetical protein [Altererythrobacter epoxidivorans]
MTALISIDQDSSSPLPGAKPVSTFAEGARYSIFNSRAQGAFLDSLAQYGNVRLACRAGRVSPQTAYRARRTRPAFAALWDAALLSARTRAEEVLADRALNGVEEQVFYHGEEVATRRRYDSRLLLAHLARLDRLAERAEVGAATALLDDAIDALRRGEELPHALPEKEPQDSVPCVPSGRNSPPCKPPVETPSETLDTRLDAMEAARPAHALPPHQLCSGVAEVDALEALQLAAFEAGYPQWYELREAEEWEEEGACDAPHDPIA